MASEVPGVGEAAYRRTSDTVVAVIAGVVGLVLVVAALGNLINEDQSVAGAVVCVLLALFAFSLAWSAWQPKTDEQRNEDRERAADVRRARVEARQERATAKSAPATRAGSASARAGRLDARGEWVPPAPVGVPFEAKNFPEGTTDVVGESYHEESWVALFGGEDDFDKRGAQRLDVATLTRDLKNPYDLGGAVSVWVGGHHVGHLPREISREWVAILGPIEARGQSLQVAARVWGRRRSDSDITGSVTLFTGIPPRGWRPR